MTDMQLQQIINFCRPYYLATGRWHAWDHITAVQRLAIAIAEAEYPEADKDILLAAATIHDMGRIVRDEGHAEESGRIAEPFLRAIDLPAAAIDTILDAVTHHDVKKIEQSKSLEARIVYDADKIEILSTYGFLRVAFWLVEERKMELGEAVRFLYDYCQRFQATLFSDYAREFVKTHAPIIDELVSSFNGYEQVWRKPA